MRITSREEESACQPLKAGARSSILRVQRYTNSVIMPKKRERKTSPIQEEVIEAISQMLFNVSSTNSRLRGLKARHLIGQSVRAVIL